MSETPDMLVTPWFSQDEWTNVAQCVIHGTDPGFIKEHFENESWMVGTVSNNQIEAYQLAIEQITVWKSRTHRLPAGVETTLCLLQGAIAQAKSCNVSLLSADDSVTLCLATSVNRFLNLICHTGFDMFGLTKYPDVSARFGIPDWIVEVRHETAHGHMPSKELLLDALAFSLKWIVLNYWIPEVEANNKRVNEENNKGVGDQDDYIKNTSIYKKLHMLLDCFRYLKLYTVWGGVHKIGDLKDQSEIYIHVTEHLHTLLYAKNEDSNTKNNFLLYSKGYNQENGSTPSRNKQKRKLPPYQDASKNDKMQEIDNLKIGNATHLIRDKIHSFICSLTRGQWIENHSPVDCRKSFVQNLLFEEFLMPSRDFFDTLNDHDSDKISTSSASNIWTVENLLDNFGSIIINSQLKPLKLPRILVQLWSDIIQMLAADGPEDLILDLFSGLHDISGCYNLGATRDENILTRCLASAWIIEICNSLSVNMREYKNANKEFKNKKHGKASKERLVENVNNFMKLSNINIASTLFQETCNQVVMNPLTELALSHLPSVLSLVLTRNKDEENTPENGSLVPIEENKKTKIINLVCLLFGIKSNAYKILKTNTNNQEEISIKTVDSISEELFASQYKPDADDKKSKSIDYETISKEKDLSDDIKVRITIKLKEHL